MKSVIDENGFFCVEKERQLETSWFYLFMVNKMLTIRHSGMMLYTCKCLRMAKGWVTGWVSKILSGDVHVRLVLF